MTPKFRLVMEHPKIDWAYALDTLYPSYFDTLCGMATIEKIEDKSAGNLGLRIVPVEETDE